MDKDSILSKLTGMIARYVPIEPSDIDPNQDLEDEMGLDIVDVEEFIYEIEAEFNIKIPEEDMVKIHSLSDAADLILAKTAR